MSISSFNFKSSCPHFNTYLSPTSIHCIQQLDAFLWFLFSQNQIFFHSHGLSCQVEDSCTHSDNICFCLECKQPCCMNYLHSNASHIMKHFHSNEQHKIYFQFQKQRFFCCSCRDFVMFLHSEVEEECFWKQLFPKYSPIFSSAKMYRKLQNFKKKQELVPYEQMKLPISVNKFFGLRGINNLGNTCFLGTVVQCLTHVPPLVDYFLSSIHWTSSPFPIFELNNEKSVLKSELHTSNSLFSEFYKLITEMYSGDTKPFNINSFIYSIWLRAFHLAGYKQQDAHEFLISILDFISTDETRYNNTSGIPNIIDTLFRGQQKSNLICNNCKHISSTYESFLDVSLQIKFKSNHNYEKDYLPENENSESAPQRSATKTEIMTSIFDCLQRYIRLENLEVSDYCCSHCKTKGVAISKQLFFYKLPTILIVQLKRFESHLEKKSTKIDNYVEFPFEMDMLPFVTSSADVNTSTKQILYELISVIVHHGTLDTGHYTCYIKHQQRWYLCDDSQVYQVDETEVRKCKAYILFYARNVFYFE